VPAIAGTFSYFERSHDMENAIGPTPGREPDETTRMWLDTLYQLLNGWLSVNAVDVPLLLSQLCTLPPRFQERNRAAVARSLRARLRDNGYQLGTTQLSVLQQLVETNSPRPVVQPSTSAQVLRAGPAPDVTQTQPPAPSKFGRIPGTNG